MTEVFGQVESVCPECLRRLTGRLVGEGDCVRLEKSCPDHGSFAATVWRGKPPFLSWFRPKLPFSGGDRRPAGRGCPLDCGLCEAHGQRTCTVLVEITSRCNLRCPVCFADSGGSAADPDPATLTRMFAGIMAQTGGCNLQLSGGEPTVRYDLPGIVESARKAGFTFIQLNSNGLAFASDPDLAGRLHDAGLSSVFLQFDGLRDEVYTTLRGRRLLAEKRRAIDYLAAAGLGIVLVPTVVRGVNTEQLWDIVRFGLDREPHVRGVHFQPISYFGRFPAAFAPDHVTLPELMTGLAEQSGGLLKLDDFRPPGCEHALCSFSAKYLVQEDGCLQRLGSAACDCTPKPAEEGALTAIAVTARQWGSAQEIPDINGSGPGDGLNRFLRRARSHTFAVSAMAFQDAWSLNLERLRGCCIHVAQPDGRLIPFCSFNLTARDGRSLHRPRRQSPPGRRTPVDGLVAARFGIDEPLCREELERAQLDSLRRTIRHARTNSPLYRELLSGLDPDGVQSLGDLARLPLLTAHDLTSQGQRLLAVSQSLVSRVITMQTSGSTGVPKRLSFTAADLAATTEFFHCGMHSLINKNDRVLVLLPFAQPDSVGDLLIRALQDGGIGALGMWPPEPATAMAEAIREQKLTCAVGLPQHLLALAHQIGPGALKSMLLCSDYAASALRRQIEAACGCETFLHYGATESGLGGAVECSEHNGCHIRESELLVEIVDPRTGTILPEGEVGELVLTTLGREAMPLIRYRTGDMASLDRSPCRCGGVTARLGNIRGRLAGCLLPAGLLLSQDLDDLLFQIPGLLDYRATLDRIGTDRLLVDFVAIPTKTDVEVEIRRMLLQAPAIKESLANNELFIGLIRRVAGFTANHTVKRTILDQRSTGEKMQYILDRLINTLEQGQSAVLCAIVRNLGSAPRTSGARMLVLADGTIAGSVGGGAVEGACQAKAREILHGTSVFAELNFELNAASAAEAGMVCGGSVSVLLHRVEPELLTLLHRMRSEYLRAKRPLLLTMLPQGDLPPSLILLGSEGNDEVPAELRMEILRKSRRAPFIALHQGREVFVEPLVHPGRVHLAGAGHVALAMARIAAFVGFEVVVMDDRQEFANIERYPEASKVRVLDSFTDCIKDLGPDDYVIIVTRGHLHDREVLAQALRTDAGYIGMIGSKRKRAAVYDSLRQDGFTDTDLARVHCPIGLAIGADTPEEIALSIVAELVQVRAGMNG